jgi:hypothetical protein
MKLIETFDNTDLTTAIKKVVNDLLRQKISDEKAAEIADRLTISDILAMSTAYDKSNATAARNALRKKSAAMNEYSFPGRTTDAGSAGQRTVPAKPVIAQPAQPAQPTAATGATAPTTQPTAPQNPEEDELEDDTLTELRRLIGKIK